MTTNALTPAPRARALTQADYLKRKFVAYSQRAKSPGTLRVYNQALKKFVAWCEDPDHPAPSLPAQAETVAAYITFMADAGFKPAYIRVHLSAIAWQHATQGLPDPTTDARVRNLFEGICNVEGVRPVQKAAITEAQLRAMLATLPDDLKGKLKRAILLLGWWGAFRRGEFTSHADDHDYLRVSDLTFADDGLSILLRRSKTDQAGAGLVKLITHSTPRKWCAHCAVRDWLSAAAITEGAVFRAIDRYGCVRETALSSEMVSRIVKQAVAAIGLDPADYGAHSLRAGWIDSAMAKGVSVADIMAVTKQKKVETVLRYVRDDTPGQIRAQQKIREGERAR